MAEILTESFCERCGTRYTFESPARRANPLGALGTVGRGIRNFVVSPEQTIDEAFAVARAETEQRATAHQLEAFHQTFNFCLSCRQYTCGNCWNPVEGRCQSCAPIPEAEALASASASAQDSSVVAEAMAIARAATLPVTEAPDAESDLAVEPTPWVDATPELEAVREPEAELAAAPQEAIAEAETIAETPAIADPDLVARDQVAELEPLSDLFQAEPDTAPGERSAPDAGPAGSAARPASRQRPSSMPSFPPGVSLDEEIAAYELRVAAIASPPPPVVEPARPMAAAASPGAAAVSSSAAAPPPAPVVIASAVPDLPPPSLVAMPTAQTGSCAGCGLSLSATARFCRRCGTAQHA